ELMMRNTNVHTLKADAFATADCKFQLSNLAGTPTGFDAVGGGNLVADDPASDCNEAAVLIRQPDGTIQYRAVNTVDPPGINGQAVYNGTPGVDRMQGGNDNDTFWGGLSNDVIEGGAGADVALGGEGNDIITDLAGDDVPKGGPGNDAIDAGPGLDIIMGGEGKDFTDGGANANTTFAGAGDDFIKMGQGQDAAFGDSGDDWQEGGNMPDLMQGDSGNLFFLDDSQKPGSDILVGQGNDDDYDMEGGDDIGVGGPGIEKVAGGSGYDWETGQGDPQPQDLDLALPIAPLGVLTAGVRVKFNEVEALSGWKLDDKVRGDDVVPANVGGAGFVGCDVLDQAGLDRIAGLDALVPPLTTPLASVAALAASKNCPTLTGPNVWGAGDILLGGAGSDLIEGRGANDIIDGDKYLNVRLSVRNDAGIEIGSAGVEGPEQSAMNSQYLHVGGGSTGALIVGSPTLQQAVFAGTVNPGNIVAVREILTGSGGTDTAVFSGNRFDYTCTVEGGFAQQCGLTSTGTDVPMTVAHTRPGGIVGGLNRFDGTDTIRNIEVLQFADTVAPVAPTAVTARAGNARATVSWTQPPGNPTGFEVRVVDAADVQVGGLRPAAANATSLDVTELVNGTAVRFQVRATNAVGTSPFSALSTAVTPAGAATAPATPATPTVTAGNASALVNFTAPTNGGLPITGFSVQVVDATTNAPVGAVRPAAEGATSLNVTGLTNGTAVRFQVQATNAVGPGPFSALSNAVTPVIPGTQNQRYVSRVYLDLFNRAPDAAGLAGWTAKLDSGTPRVAVANAITSSPEYRSKLIAGSYAKYLGRTPDPTGLSGWLAAMNRGITISQMESGFIASNEYYAKAGATNAAWVGKLYSDVLGRTAPSAEVAKWTAQLNAGTASRTKVAMGFLLSTERLSTVVNGYYVQLLGRALDPSGQATWVRILQAGGRNEAIIGSIVSSTEYFIKAGSTNSGWVTALYRDVLNGRTPSLAEVNFWTGRLSAGMSR
ncbi:MAG: DUF4214 domain-containing protein, partial [Chloroflexota bacterium]|nr:DUF4214 domain-containing protein [Chloroflexota bacterium]